MAEEVNGATPQEAPAPPPTKAKPKHKLSTQGKKPGYGTTKAEMTRERLTSKIIACLVLGKTIEETAEELQTSVNMVFRVRKELPEEFLEYFSKAKSNEISALIEEGLRAQLLAMIKIVEVTNDEVWLKAQRAPELATFFGVINDKTVRVLAAIERADERARLEREQRLLPPSSNPTEPKSRREPQNATQGA